LISAVAVLRAAVLPFLLAEGRYPGLGAAEDQRMDIVRAFVGIHHLDRKSTRLNSSHRYISRMPSSA
jgi:hypothetical protein